MRRLLLCLTIAGFGLCGFARAASAYTQFQFSSGTNKCSQCHFSPAGGGLLSSWGRSEAGDTISIAGNGAFAHGAVTLPSWLALGMDLRLAGTRTTDGSTQSPQGAVFPMLWDGYARFAFTDAFSFYVTGGVRGETRPADDSLAAPFTTAGNRFISREHFLMWRPSATGPYARLGRFYAPYGLRFVEHIFYVRRYTGYELYNETYTASGGYVGEDWELHLSVFTPPPSAFPDPLQSVGARESGGAGYFERRLGGFAALAAQARVGIGKEASRSQGGLVGKLWVEPAKLLFLGEANLIHQRVAGVAPNPTFAQNQFVSYVGANYFPVQGLMLGAAYERFQENLQVQGTARNAISGQINFFPYAHCEVSFLYRYQIIGGQNSPATLALLQLHYYL
jgi:hypothetical protein